MPRRVGYSQFRDFKKCPLFHHWKYVERKPEPVSPDRDLQMTRGSLVQAMVEAFYRDELWRKPDPQTALYEALQQAATAFKLPLSQGSALIDVSAQVPAILETMRRERLVETTSAVEYGASLTVSGVIIHCRIDLLVKNPVGIITLIDGKWSTPDLDQLRVYALALMTDPAWGFPARIGTWAYKKSTVAWTRFTRAKVYTFCGVLQRVMEKFVAGSREARTGSHCRRCGYQAGCEAYALSVRAKQAKAPEVPSGGGFISMG